MAVTTQLIQRFREQTGAGILDAKKMLEEANGDYDKAIELLRKKGQKVAAKKQDRNASEGLVEAYIHNAGRVGVILKLNCETDFVARTDKFKDLAHQVAMHIAAFNPIYIASTDVPADIVAKEKDVYQELLVKEGKPANMMEKVIEGKLQKYFAEVCLLEQAYLMDDSITVKDVVTAHIAELGENIVVAEFKRLAL